MEYLGDKLNSVTGNALSGINQLKRKRNKHQESEPSEEINNAEEPHQQVRATMNTVDLNAPNVYPKMRQLPSMPFGADTFSTSAQANPAPPIGFNVGILGSKQKSTTGNEKTEQSGQAGQPNIPTNNQLSAASDQSLYEGDAWQRLWFQRVMILSIIRLLIFIRKLYEDFHATKTYNLVGNTGHFLISAATLFLPTIVFTIYRVARYLQVELPSMRAAGKNDVHSLQNQPTATRRLTELKKLKNDETADHRGDEEEAHLRKALMSATGAPANSNTSNQDEDGLVTARQSPVILEEFHDSKSQQGHISPAPSGTIDPKLGTNSEQKKTHRRSESNFRETVDVNKLGNIPDKNTTRVTIGASEQLLHGVLFVFWQLKRQVDVLAYLVERSCLWRRPRDDEKEELGRLRTGSDGLEWFQDFYAAFLAILAQVYTLGSHWSHNGPPLSASTIDKALSGVNELPDISKAARQLGNVLSQQELNARSSDGKDLLIISEILVSSAVVFSLLVAVRRRDDGPLTLGLSMLGWGSIFASRIIIIALAFVHIGWKIMLSLVVVHVLGITGWIYKIAIDSHNNKPSESEEYKWDEQCVEEKEPRSSIELESGQDSGKSGNIATSSAGTSRSETDQWSPVEHVVLLAQILSLFAVPSLFYWPIMFNLKFHCRPFKYLVLIMTENFILVPAIWLSISSTATAGQWYLLGAVGGFSIIGFVFVSLYVSCKPSLTEYFARADELFNEAEKSGIYFEFCSRVFKMPDLSKQCFRRLMVQTEQEEEVSA